MKQRLENFLDKRRVAIGNLACDVKEIDYDLNFDVEDHNNNSSGDEQTYKDKRYLGSFSKLLEHDSDGLLTEQGVQEYEKLVSRMKFDSDPNSIETNGDLNGVRRANEGDEQPRIWVNPQSAFSYSLKGGDISFFKMRAAPALNSIENAAEMMEVYLQTLCRDVAFNDYGTGLRTDKYVFNRDAQGNSTGQHEDSLTKFACKVLNQFGDDFRGLKDNTAKVTPQTLFRGVAKKNAHVYSDAIGGYLSQFLLQPLYPLFPAGCAPFVGGKIGVNKLNQEVLAKPQHYPIAGEREFGISMAEFVQIQNGFIPKQYEARDYNQDYQRHIKNGRDMGSLVHTDSPYEAYYNALNILVYNDFPRSDVFPYNNNSIQNEGAGHTMGPSDIYVLIAEVCLEAFKAAWAQKWRLHRKLRPEAMAGIVHLALQDTDQWAECKSALHPSMFEGDLCKQVLEMIRQRNKAQSECCRMLAEADAGTYLLAQMYPEGSPAHPAYPSGHATVAGACTTVIKAIFDDTQNFAAHLDRNNTLNEKTKVARPHPDIETQLQSLGETHLHYVSRTPIDYCHENYQQMTVGSELDKLASNIALGRNFGGVHYRQDGDEGILLGEKVAIKYLQDHLLSYTENNFTGYTLTRRNGTRIKITADSIDPIIHSTNLYG